MVCSRSVEAIRRERVAWYMERSNPRDDPENITRLRREAYKIGLNADSFLFLASSVSPAAACDGKTITTSAEGQESLPGTLSKIQSRETFS